MTCPYISVSRFTWHCLPLKTIVANQTAFIRKIIKSNNIELIDQIRIKFDKYRVNTSRERLITDLIIQTGSAIYDLYFQSDEIFNAMI